MIVSNIVTFMIFGPIVAIALAAAIYVVNALLGSAPYLVVPVNNSTPGLWDMDRPENYTLNWG